MLFAILGTVNRDRIVTEDGSVHESLGGVLYNALTLARCVGEGDRIRLVARLGEEDRAAVLALLAALETRDRAGARLALIDASGLAAVPGPSNETTLTYTGPDTRTETLIDRVAPLTDDEVRSAGEADFLLANLISGWDFTPAQLAGAVGVRGARVFLDIQSLNLAPPGPDGLRAQRDIPDWASWCAAVEIVKGNASEVGSLVGRRLASRHDLDWAASRVFEAGSRALVVTLGVRGAYAATRAGEGSAPRGRVVPAVPGVRVVDSTGCGDGFASAFLAEYAKSGDALRAACAGNAVAALVAARRGLAPLHDLPDPRPLTDRLIAVL